MKINFKPGKGNKMHIYIDGEYRLTADCDFVFTCGFDNNSEISDEELAFLTDEVNSRRAFLKACDLLALRDHSSRELLTKLRQKGYGEGAEQAVEKLMEEGYVDDERFARAYAAELVRVKHFGRRRIVTELLKKGIDPSLARDIADETEVDEDEILVALKRKYGRCLDTEKGVRRAVNGLAAMGYGYSEIKQAIETIKEEAETDYE
ncbi:MAG: recombination regulator RecX [Oscillospiraceae bacterium]|nr:recombination regulator RecX [Oscillospiraceae bacterium]